MTRGVELASDCFLCLSRNKKNKKSIWIHHSHIMRDAIFIIIVFIRTVEFGTGQDKPHLLTIELDPQSSLVCKGIADLGDHKLFFLIFFILKYIKIIYFLFLNIYF
jgi:hypothetical protein